MLGDHVAVTGQAPFEALAAASHPALWAITGAAMLEHQHAPLAPRKVFVRRVLRNAALALGFIAFSLGYHGFEGLDWLQAALNAAMILTGMGPVDTLHTTGGKIFAIAYCIYSGVAFLTTAALLLAPVVHRFIHRFHLEAEGKK